MSPGRKLCCSALRTDSLNLSHLSFTLLMPRPHRVQVWRADGTCLASISHPGCVWAAAFLPNGDVLSGCADGVTRVWTADPARADPDAIAAFSAATAAREAEVAAAAAKAQGGAPSGLKMEDASVLQRPGGRDGETKVVREAGAGVAYSWDAGTGQWERIGEVVGGPAVRSRWAPLSRTPLTHLTLPFILQAFKTSA